MTRRPGPVAGTRSPRVPPDLRPTTSHLPPPSPCPPVNPRLPPPVPRRPSPAASSPAEPAAVGRPAGDAGAATGVRETSPTGQPSGAVRAGRSDRRLLLPAAGAGLLMVLVVGLALIGWRSADRPQDPSAPPAGVATPTPVGSVPAVRVRDGADPKDAGCAADPAVATVDSAAVLLDERVIGLVELRYSPVCGAVAPFMPAPAGAPTVPRPARVVLAVTDGDTRPAATTSPSTTPASRPTATCSPAPGPASGPRCGSPAPAGRHRRPGPAATGAPPRSARFPEPVTGSRPGHSPGWPTPARCSEPAGGVSNSGASWEEMAVETRLAATGCTGVTSSGVRSRGGAGIHGFRFWMMC